MPVMLSYVITWIIYWCN